MVQKKNEVGARGPMLGTRLYTLRISLLLNSGSVCEFYVLLLIICKDLFWCECCDQ